MSLAQPRVVIVGAGIAGLAAARTLCQDGRVEVIILEAMDRTGGRIHTQEYSSRHIEYGAQWLHGEGGNPLHDIAVTHNMIDEEEPYETDLKSMCFTQNGCHVSTKLVRQVENVIEDLFEDANKFYRLNIPLDPSIQSVGDFFRQGFECWLQNSKNKNSEQLIKLKEAIFTSNLALENIENGCDSMYDLNLEAWGLYDECEGHEEVNLKDGFSRIIDIVASTIPKHALKLSTPVKQIQWEIRDDSDLDERTNENPLEPERANENFDRTKPCRVITEDEGIFCCDYVIVTSSVGFLKQAEDFFSPKLPCDKVEAIEKIAFGVVDKLFLEFEEPFWSKDLDSYKLLWMKDEPFELEAHEGITFEKPEDEFWYKDIPTFDTLNNQPNVLIGWISGRGARVMETLPEDVVRDACVELLQRFTGNQDIPKPVRFIRTCWYSNPYIRGSYTYSSKLHDTQVFRDFSRPLPDAQCPRLMFAGEACHQRYYSTAHGAFLSGEAEARRLIENLQV